MAKKTAKHAIPSVFDGLELPPLPPSVRPLFLPKLLAEAAGILSADAPARDRAYDAFRKRADDMAAGIIHAQNETQREQDFYKDLLRHLGYATSTDVATGQPWTMQVKRHEPGVGTADVALGSFRLGPTGQDIGPRGRLLGRLEQPAKNRRC
jgi:hypothetical protein